VLTVLKRSIESLWGSLLKVPRIERRLYLFVDVHRFDACVRKLLRNGVQIRVVYDIGARHGDWSFAASRIIRHARFVLFEANESCREVLERSGFSFFIGVLSSDIKKVQFYENDSTGDSYYREASIHYRAVTPKERATTTLDGLIDAHGLAMPDLIKIDTQGSELDILKGAGHALCQAVLVYLECSLVECNEGGPLLKDYLEFMGDHGFVPYEICEQHFSQGVLAQIDIMFIRRSVCSSLREAPAGRWSGFSVKQ
jgi:FkbM family methyltransferase